MKVCKMGLSESSSRLTIFLILVVLFDPAGSYAQQRETVDSVILPRELIDLPVAATLDHGDFGLGLRVYPNGGVLSDLSVGLYNRFLAVVYYGGENIIGEGSVNWNPKVRIDFRLRLIDESLLLPGIAIGISTQGNGRFIDETNRYSIKSRGVYVVGSRNYVGLFGDIGVHFGANISFERDDDDKDLNLFAGANIATKTVGEALFEYDLASNDNEILSEGGKRGYFNSGYRFFISNNFILSFYLKNLFENTKSDKDFGREIRIEYRNSFLR